MSSSLGTITELLSEVFDVASKNFGMISKILKNDKNLFLSVPHSDEELAQDTKKKKNNLPHLSEVWDLEEIEAFESARKEHGDDFDELCKSVPKRKRSEVKRLLGHYKIAFPLDKEGNIIEYDSEEDEGSEEEEVEEPEEEPIPPAKKQKSSSKKEKTSSGKRKSTRNTKPTVEDSSDSE